MAISYARPGIVDQILGRQPDVTPTVDQIDLTIGRGETVGLVGESGSGKSTILRAIAGLWPPRGGTITYGETESLNTSVDERPKDMQRRVQLIFQNPDASLNPRHTVSEILAQPLKLYFGLGGDALRERSVALLERMRLVRIISSACRASCPEEKNSALRWREPLPPSPSSFCATRSRQPSTYRSRPPSSIC